MSPLSSKVRLIDIVVVNEAQVLVEKTDNVSVWFKSSKLSLNVDKNKQPLFHPLYKRKFLPQTLPNTDQQIKR